jgi:hypothetical protein
MKKIVAVLDRIALKDVLNPQALLALRFLHSGSAGVIVVQLLFVHSMTTRPASSDTVLTAGERAEFYRAWCRAINRLSRELTHGFLREDGSIDWRHLLQGKVLTA